MKPAKRSEISKENFFWRTQVSSYLGRNLSTVLCQSRTWRRRAIDWISLTKDKAKGLYREEMIGDQVKCFRVGPCIATPWDLRQKKKATKTSWWQWGGRAEKNLRFKPASCTTVDKVSCVHKEFTGIISSDILVNVQQLIFQKQKDLTVALAYFHIPTMAEFKPPLV